MDYENFLEEMLELKNSLEDDISKEIFEAMFLQKFNFGVGTLNLLKSMTNKILYIESIENFMKDPNYQQILNVLDNYNAICLDEKIVLFGVDERILYLLELSGLIEAENVVICAKSSNAFLESLGKPIISYEDLILHYRDYKLILLPFNLPEIYKELVYIGFNKNNLWKLGRLDPNQYFDEIVKLSENEVFVDFGGLTGETSLEFAKRTNYTYKQIYIFEPDPSNYEKTINNINTLNLKNVKVFNIGGWSKKDILRFKNNGTGQSKIEDAGTCQIEVDSLDNILGDTPVTFIKMDVEGAELETLIGAQEIIKKYKPQLAISIYHKPEDIFEIPTYIKELVPEYKLYFRKYEWTFSSEIILHAFI
ncbi:hypothetical protein AN396_10560 [Candidatus Epulonipiscium fishelsonii]|uniref:Uncharacterized protein n=1 Tax=Candidatus Epulonipiscium fishelsonii TaxID=77094 RepID=A0ACC8X8T8_9FIRM|nr:hypothetical protein AN396_10560 [Epulopiscium sp. SCG-B11WGA-EpuloA1]